MSRRTLRGVRAVTFFSGLICTTACQQKQADGRNGGAEATATEPAFRVAESTRYGEDEIFGMLHVSTSAAYFEGGGRRISLIQASPVVAVDTEMLKSQTAQALRVVSGKHVRARGELQGSILWDATVAPTD
jgi:hypothetical protein